MATHPYIKIIDEKGESVEAIAPVIVSASRATDIPAFYAEEFFRDFEKGYCTWRNPFNGKEYHVSFSNTRFIVFWSKNPRPLMPYLKKLRDKGIEFYIQYTLNDYEEAGLEPFLPTLDERVDTFRLIVDQYGPGHAIWRYDPLILTDKIGTDQLLHKISNISDKVKGYTEKLVFSFADIETYKRVGNNLRSAGINYIEWEESTMRDFALRLAELNEKEMNLQMATCAESIDLSEYGIGHNRCIDPDLISRLAADDLRLQMWLFGTTKDQGQRKACGCILSKDIGTYNTCPHGCLYCYANHTPLSVKKNYDSLKQKSI